MTSEEYLKKKGLIAPNKNKFIIQGDFGKVCLNDLLSEFLGINLLENRNEFIEKFPFLNKENKILYCFECEIPTSYNDIKGDKFCKQCGLKH